MLNSKTFHKTLLALVISAAISACNGSVSSDKTDVSFGDNPSETDELASYGSPAEKADLFSSYTGVLGDNLADPSEPSYDRTVYINLSDLSVSTDDISYFSIADFYVFLSLVLLKIKLLNVDFRCFFLNVFIHHLVN